MLQMAKNQMMKCDYKKSKKHFAHEPDKKAHGKK
jgi:hypothetical protein